jgi:ATP-dependent Clp protease, protease subunit
MQSNRPLPIVLCGTPPSNRKQPYFAKTLGRAFAKTIENGATTIDLFDEIGAYGVSAKDFRAQLNDVTGNIVLRINSPGGDVFDGLAIFNSLVAHDGFVRIEITGVAASAASIIAMAGDEIAIAENAFLMIHNAWGVTIGNQDDHDEASDLLGQIDNSLANTYAKRTGLDIRAIARMMADETWFGSTDAKANGFATEIIQPRAVNAKFDVSSYSNAPSQLTSTDAAIDLNDINIRDLEKILRDAGIPRRKAKALAGHGIKASPDLRDEEDEVSDELAAFFAAKANSISALIKELN